MLSHDAEMVLIGGLVGLISSFIVIWVQYRLNHKGEARIYYKIISIPKLPNNRRGWGCIQANGKTTFWIPMAIELQNTSNVTRVVRDFQLHLYKGDESIGKMTQLESMHHITKENSEIIDFGTDKNSYSFTLPPTSIQKQTCLFGFTIRTNDQQANTFDNVRVRFYDEKDTVRETKMIDDFSSCWDTQLRDPETEWTRLNFN